MAFNSVDFPVEGNPTSTAVASPLFFTEKPSPPPPAFSARWTASSFTFASLAFKRPMCFDVALL